MSEIKSGSKFHSTISVLDKWDSETQTVLPADVKKEAISAEKNNPNKRLIIHFLQPHAPFIGDTAKEIRNKTGKTIGGLNPGREYTNVESQNINTTSYRDMLELDYVSEDEIVTAYRESLAEVLSHVGELIIELEGKTVITADHGELLGEKPNLFSPIHWEHPSGYRSEELCKVPWIEFDSDGRKEIIDEAPAESSEFDQREVNERLRSLGYSMK